MTTDCTYCGADKGLHHYQTMQCPVNGREAAIGNIQEWMIGFEFKDGSAARIAELEAENINLHDDLLATASYLCRELSKNGIGNHSGNFLNCTGGICVSTRALISPKGGA